MKLWILLASPFAVLGAHALYNTTSSGQLAAWEGTRSCINDLTDEGLLRQDAKDGCECAMREAKSWAAANPGAEYTLATHRRVAGSCFARIERRIAARKAAQDGSASSAAGDDYWGSQPDAGGEDAGWSQ